MKDMVTGLGKPKRVSKISWECKIENGPRMPNERNKPREPTSNVMGQGSTSTMNEDLIAMMGHRNQVKERHIVGSKKAQQAWIK